MPDWKELVQRQLAGLAVDVQDKADVHAELADHLEESYEILRAYGLSERAAAQQTHREVSDWRDLQDQISRAKNGGPPMKTRLHQVWIPGMSIFALSTATLILLQGSPFQDDVAWVSRAHMITRFGASLPWLLSLPCLGAFAAWLSSRAGGSRRTILIASVFPAPALGLAFLLMFPIGLAMEWVTGRHNDFGIVAVALLGNWVGWILVPGATLLVGGLLVMLLLSNRTADQPRVVS